MQFQSTLSVRRATLAKPVIISKAIFQSTLSVRRATYLQYASQNVYLFQSTLSVRRATLHIPIHSNAGGDFNPRSPWGERPNNMGTQNDLKYISIHALREESDSTIPIYLSSNLDFNPRSPWGERLVGVAICGRPVGNFNPRSPWGERRAPSICRGKNKFNFNPRSPWGERRFCYKSLSILL